VVSISGGCMNLNIFKMGHIHSTSLAAEHKEHWNRFTILRSIGGIYTNSIAIVSDAVLIWVIPYHWEAAGYLQHKVRKNPTIANSIVMDTTRFLEALINSVVLICGKFLQEFGFM
jgi:hypothetical protein